jgi:predicted metalloprotease
VVDVELQADCLAGTWSRTRSLAGQLSDSDIAAALGAVAAVGDTELTDPNHHGTPERRRAAWLRGLSGQDCPLGGS